MKQDKIDELIRIGKGIKAALDRCHEHYPDSRSINVLHRRLDNLADFFRENCGEFGLEPEVVVNAGGGTPKTKPNGDDN